MKLFDALKEFGETEFGLFVYCVVIPCLILALLLILIATGVIPITHDPNSAPVLICTNIGKTSLCQYI